ncbi:tax1-binding protein 1 homolog B-like isoform X10 [Oncorhynchus masou masou]|uniref:tax1-binding protein 1 homolog B-like isoform X10 n=1 Tax=Oncorhynchus masou masou TaxID=90313 RepID=UPI003183FDDC
MESFETAANMELSTNFSQVVFQEIPNSYVSNVALTCCYTLTAAIQPNPRDWVGIFKVGWSTTKDYHTFVWVEPSLDLIGLEPVRKQVLFTELIRLLIVPCGMLTRSSSMAVRSCWILAGPGTRVDPEHPKYAQMGDISAYYLPKDDSAFYQFCYVDSHGQVRGASTPFCFKTPGEQGTDCSLENDLLVIITQEKVEQREREKEELVMELGKLKEQNETLRSALKEQQQEIDHLKLSNEELYQADGNTENARKHEELTQNTKLMDDLHRGQEEEVEKSEREKEELTMELGQLKEQNETLTCALKEQKQEIDHLKESKKELVQLVSKLEQQQENTREHEELAQNAKSLDESQRGQEVDLQSSEKEKEKLSAALHRVCGVTHDLQDLKTGNKALRRSLSEQEQQPLQMVDSDWKEQYQALLVQLEEAQTLLHKELQASNNTRKRAEQAERELEELKECMESTAMTSDQTKQKSSKLEMQLSELNKIIEEKENMAEIAKIEKEELSRENQDLKRDIERLRKEFDDVQAAPVPMQHPNPYGSSTDPTPNKEQQQEALADSLHSWNPYETPGTATNLEEELSLECRHCHESFPGITQDELELHEHSHRVCPFCMLICDGMEQALYEDHVYSHEV